MATVSPQAVKSFLAQTSIFQACPPELLDKLSPHVEHASYGAGSTLVPPGRPVGTLNFLYQGRASLQLIDPRSGNRVALEDVLPGDTYAEVGLALGGVAPLVTVAWEACEALLVHKAHFDKMAELHPPLSHALAKRIAARFVKVSMMRAQNDNAGSGPPAPAPAPVAAEPARDPNVIPFMQVAKYSPNPKVLAMVPTRLIQEHRVIPLELRGRSLVVGMVNPHSIAAREELRKVCHSVDPDVVGISSDDFSQAIARFKLDPRDNAGPGGGQVTSRALRPQYYAEVSKEADKGARVVGDDAVVLLDQIILEGLERGASDIQVEPEASGVRVSYRVQGLNQDRKELIPANFATPLIARLKILAELDITERRIPQDGRIVAKLGRRELNMRIGTIPTARGEKAFLRLLDPSDVMRPLEQIVLDSRALEVVKTALSIPQGAVICGGPSGSGKTSTLYSLVNQRKMAKQGTDIVMAEDPIEFLLAGVTQAPVNSKTGMGYPQVVRALLRSHPEVVVIGELVDPETANIMAEAALTGTQVLTTMHASNVQAVLQRLAQFNVDPVMVAQSVSVVMTQKLVRKLCSSCVKEEEVAPALMESLRARHLLPKGGSTRLPRAGGCEACGGTGFFGRMPVVEVFAFDPDLRLAYSAGEPVNEVMKKAVAAGRFLSFAQSARLLMAKRVLTPADALAVTG